MPVTPSVKTMRQEDGEVEVYLLNRQVRGFTGILSQNVSVFSTTTKLSVSMGLMLHC